MSLFNDNYHKWVNKVMSKSSDVLSAQSKMIAIILPDVIRWHTMKGDITDDKGRQKIAVQTVASFSGVHRNSVSRVLHQFKKDGLVEYVTRKTFDAGIKSITYIKLGSKFLDGDISTTNVKNRRYKQKNYELSPCCGTKTLIREGKQEYGTFMCVECGEVHTLPLNNKKRRLIVLDMLQSDSSNQDLI